MKCSTVKLPNGTVAIVCGKTRVVTCACGRPAPYLCDWKIGTGKTCDKPLCKEHALRVAPDKDLCPDHQRAYAEWKARRPTT